MDQLRQPDYVARECASLDRTGWPRFDELDGQQTLLEAIAEVRPARVLDVGCGEGLIPSTYSAPAGRYPLVATRAKCVFVADAA